ncbi:AGAP006990-PB [Anopheles gambiae str. PEST]|uniref:AGAP006990-PB n=1 Tax=Anopheles gambiae TaxID=7165 RepID=Q7QIP2_ANOGA|nr:AGAP006990-PB [Anopheles gambiae str. PEST]
MTTDVVKIERTGVPMAIDESTNDASGASFSSVSGGGGGAAGVGGGGTVAGSAAGTPRESAKSQNLRRTLAKPAMEKDKCSFLNDLQTFHEKHGTPYLKLPKISGKDVDLHKLYSIVIGRGGWMKVNAREDWDEVIEELDLPTRCVNNEIALKQIYIRYLDRYERVNFHGEDKDPAEDEDDEKRLHRRWSVRMLHSTPTVYNHHQHNVPEGLRSSLKLSDDLYRASEYDKLILSLLSPLPNEQDFAINVCTLMSNENKHTLKVDKCPRLVYVLLAHAGVFNHFSLRDTFDEYYSNIRKNSLQRFWKECLFEKPQPDEEMDGKSGGNDGGEAGKRADSDFEIMKGRLSTATLRTFLSLGTGLGTNDYIGQRVLQIAAIFRNLSFNEENLPVLGHNRTFIRFLIMCANSRWNNLHHLGLDMLGNIANEIDINDPQSDEVTRCLVSTLSEGLEGADRGVIISCLEVLSKIAQKESNEENLNRCLNQQLYDQICLFLCLNDIMLLLYTLECIYSLTSMGEKPCNAIMHIRGVIDTLVSLVTVEAQSYGPDACILMRVVETIPGNMATHHAQGAYYANAAGQPGQANPPPPTMTQLTVHKDAAQVQSGGQGQVGNNPHVVYPTPEVPKLPSLTVTSKPVPSSPHVPQQPVQQQQIVLQAGTIQTQQQAQESEQFAYAWLRASFEAAPAVRMDQQELYKLYLATNGKLGRKVVLPQTHFPRCVRAVFGGTVGPVQLKIEQKGIETVGYYYEGLRLRAKPLPIVHKGTVLVSMSNVNVLHLFSSNSVPTQSRCVSSTTVSTTIAKPATVISNAGTASGRTIVSTGQETYRSLEVIQTSLSQATPTTSSPGTFRSSSVIAMAPPSSNASTPATMKHQPQTSGQTVSVLHKTIPTPLQAVKSSQQQTQPRAVTIGKQLIVTQVGGKNVLINKAAAGVVQRQQMQKQKQLIEQKLLSNSPINPSVVVTSNNPNNLTNIKVGNSTISIKPGTLPTNTVITATNPHETSFNAPPPLAPLSQTGIQQGTIIKTIAAAPHDPSQHHMGSPGGSKLLPNKHNAMGGGGTLQLQKATAAPGGALMQSSVLAAPQHPQPTQYILATNPQGQTYVVAQQPQPQPQLQQTQPQQQQTTATSLPQMTMQSAMGPNQGGQTTQKIFLNQQGQQILMTQLPRQMIVSHAGPSVSGGATIITSSAPTMMPGSNTAAPSGQHAGQHIVQKVLHQQQPTQQQQQQHHLIHTIKGNQSQMITVQQQKQPMATITSQQAHPQPSTSQLPSTLSIQRQTVGGSSLSQTLVPPKPVPVPNQYFQVVQQKISPAPSQGAGGGNTAQQGTQQHLRHMAGPSGATVTSQGGQQSLVPSITVTAIPAHSATTPTTTSTITSGQFAASLMAQAAGLNVPVTTTTSATVSAATASSISTSSVPAAASAQPTVTAQPPPQPPPPPPPIANTITIPVSVATANGGTSTSIQMIPAMDPQKIVEEDVDPSWPWVCDWRGCPRKKFQSATEVFRHACTVHCPDTVDVSADIYCQWGPGPNLCDNLPRKRFSLMTHLLDRHCTADSFKTAVQRRLAGGPQQPVQPYPVTLIRQPAPANAAIANSSSASAAPSSAGDRGSPAPASCTKVESTGGTSEGSSGSGSSSTNGPGQLSAAGPAAMHAIKRYSMDYVNSKEFQDEMEGPVTKSIRLTSALILRNLVVYTNSAKRSLRMYEAHLAGVALSNVESSRTVAQLLFEMNDTGPNY